VPKASEEAVAALADLVSPMSAFVRDRCDHGADYEIRIDTLYEGYRDWCRDSGITPVTKPMFGRDLHAVLPRLRTIQPRSDNQKRSYVGIQLKPPAWASWNSTRNASDRVSPVSEPVSDMGGTHDTGKNPVQGGLLETYLSGLNGRRPECRFQIPAQGHRADCSHKDQA
jgi:putative DNA primase/helicase